MITVISHIFNEEFLLPHWLHHHKRLFDHGVIFDYQSTDKSVEIIKEITPTWEVIDSEKFQRDNGILGGCKWTFSAPRNDAEIMMIERRLTGWKMALTTTEFLFHDDLRGYLEEFEQKHPGMGVRPKGVVMVDPLDRRSEYQDEVPLLTQKHHGYFQHRLLEGVSVTHKFFQKFGPKGYEGRCRLLHQFCDGNYLTGRHSTKHKNVWPQPGGVCGDESDLMICWFSWSPYDKISHRKGHAVDRVAKESNVLHLKRHTLNLDEAEILYMEEIPLTGDLLENDEYRTMYKKVRAMYELPISPHS